MENNEEVYGITSDTLDKLLSIMDSHLKGKSYDENSTSQLINDILEDVMQELHLLKKPYKYITNCMLSQRIGTGLANITSAYWDKQMDFVYHVFYPKNREKNDGKEKPLISGILTVSCISYSNNTGITSN